METKGFRLMPRHFSAQARVALLFYTSINIVLFTGAIYAVSLFPPLTANAGLWLALIVGACLLITAPVAWCIGRCWPAEWRKQILAEPSPLAGAPTRPV
jgi:hypothetical protein